MSSNVYYSNNETMPAALGWTIAALYLATTFVMALITPLRTAEAVPAAAYVAVTLLWPLTPWDSYESLTYDSGWAGAVLYTLIPSAFIWFAAYAVRKFGGPAEANP